MALKDLFKSNKGIVIPAIEDYLRTNNEENDRASKVNSPSQAGNCNRQNYYARIGIPKDETVEPRTQRIFDNGDGVHDRIQKYLERQGTLLMREVPLRNDEYNIQGHTDGLMRPSGTDELVVLEIKSINDNGFKVVSQKGQKEEHTKQANVYVFCLEERRKYLRKKYKTKQAFRLSVKARKKYFESLYQHLTDGVKYTREQKIAKKVREHLIADKLLWECPVPIKRISFIYENKNDQDMREFVVERNDKILSAVLENYEELEACLEAEEEPEREGKNKSDPICRWCSFKVECWN